MLLRLLEHVANARGADTDEHLDEVRARDREEGHPRLTCDGLGQKRFTGTGRTHHQHAAGNLAAQTLELGRVAQKVDQLDDFVLGLLAAGHITEGDLHLIGRQHPRLALAEAHGPATTPATLHLAHEVNPDTNEQENRERRNEQLHQEGLALRRLALDDHILVAQGADQRPVIRFRIKGLKLLPAG